MTKTDISPLPNGITISNEAAKSAQGKTSNPTASEYYRRGFRTAAAWMRGLAKVQIDRLEAENKALREQQEWISVEAAVPLAKTDWTFSCDVIVENENQEVRAYYHHRMNSFILLDEHGEIFRTEEVNCVELKNVKRWKPLPSPPKEDGHAR